MAKEPVYRIRITHRHWLVALPQCIQFFDSRARRPTKNGETVRGLTSQDQPPPRDAETHLTATSRPCELYEVCNENGNVAPDLATLRRRDLEGRIVESNNPKFPKGKCIIADFGWRSHTISNGKPTGVFPYPLLLPDFGDLPISYGLGILGMPGNTAYFGFLEICDPQPGKTVIVTGAAGAVGSVVGQIAKIKGCTVIGVVGSDEKGKWIVEELGFDHFINYKTADLKKSPSRDCPQRH
ncbi:hypothetical protein NQ318_022042 [Aromia moschata]|uniref:Alcohol dehydrogenase-like C-terminal domain-containing protein n=1 Tax=Aromia moschata TaxID=1265417 RepID=A0AAV8Z603_9CUCU|nr:hypothetical protein NQ318_022042 [Aromia moschata]